MPRIPVQQDQPIKGGSAQAQLVRPSFFTGVGSSLKELAIAKSNADEVLKKKKDKSDNSFILGQISSAIPAFVKKKASLKREFGEDSVEYAEKFSEFANSYTSNILSKAPNFETKNKLATQFIRFNETQIGNVWKEQSAAFKDSNSKKLELDLAANTNLISQDWPNWVSPYFNGIESLGAAKESFMNETEYQERINTFTQQTAQEVIKGFFRQEPGKLQMASDLRSGGFSAYDPELSGLYKSLSEEQRTSLADKLLSEHTGNVRISVDEQKRFDESNKLIFDRTVNEFFISDDIVDKSEIYDSVKNSQFMTADRVQSMKDALAEADGTMKDMPDVRFEVRRQIQTREITTSAELFDYIGMGLSYDSARSEMLPLIASMNDDRYQSARRTLRTSLGLPEGFIIFDKNAPKREENEALKQLEDFYADNPEADYVLKSREILKDYEATKINKKQVRLNNLNAAAAAVKAKLKANPSSDALRVQEGKINNQLLVLEQELSELIQ